MKKQMVQQLQMSNVSCVCRGRTLCDAQHHAAARGAGRVNYEDIMKANITQEVSTCFKFCFFKWLKNIQKCF